MRKDMDGKDDRCEKDKEAYKGKARLGEECPLPKKGPRIRRTSNRYNGIYRIRPQEIS